MADDRTRDENEHIGQPAEDDVKGTADELDDDEFDDDAEEDEADEADEGA